MKKAIGIIILLLVCGIFLIPAFVEYGFLITVGVVVFTALFFYLIRLAIDLITS